ncbi:MAG: hypothetical protein COV34_03370 [Candidatus Zambryskibacteria bacterium CG10_big_fil_rev_8_21_14_0_10_42_12]|uniref:VanZ-like domain-containing protein n=1 Tax=Candidatus Zambryskibacteria bacterium CG10_big_fil_rev_8_21_14_0_10_42_12 TaxID=1975115 RepID=A0A2H0QTI2_9BACT|nr:MAG: hypothetical protein COV34_03370 [Candidatus Zambryskibacteria bacterium CG10_big_fil_rev_8_21_14_0_10_42_12]
MDLQALFSWQDNTFFDLWSIVHILWGAVMGGVALHALSKTYSYKNLFITAFILIILWEYGEYLVGIIETWGNILTDVILGIGGYYLGYTLPNKLKTPDYTILIPVFVVAFTLTYIGWINYLAQ